MSALGSNIKRFMLIKITFELVGLINMLLVNN